MSEALLGARRRAVARNSQKALETLDWPDLAAYIDSLNDEYQWFLTQINNRTIGANVPKIGRPNRG